MIHRESQVSSIESEIDKIHNCKRIDLRGTFFLEQYIQIHKSDSRSYIRGDPVLTRNRQNKETLRFTTLSQIIY